MDSNGSSENDKSAPQNILGTSPGASSLRSRTDSECSDKYVFLHLRLNIVCNAICA